MSKTKVGRNDPCPCGSGKKFKRCHLDGNPQRAMSALATALADYSAADMLAVIGGLLTVPEYATATLRIEALAREALQCCRGERSPSGDDVRTWLNDILARDRVQLMEDPLEDVFVGSVSTDARSYRVLTGTWALADLTLQDTLDAVRQLPSSVWQHDLLSEANALLRLSDAVCARSRLERWAESPDQTPRATIIDAAIDVDALRRRVTFTTTELATLGIAVDSIRPFAMAEAMPHEVTDDAPLFERTPLAMTSDRLTVAYPQGVSAAIRTRVLDRLHGHHALPAFARVLRDRQNALLMQSLDRPRGPVPEAVRAGMPRPRVPLPIDEWVSAFDIDKLLHVIVLHDDIEDAARTGVGASSEMTAAATAAIDAHMRAASAFLGQHAPGGGLTLVVTAGIGRDRVLSLPRPTLPWCLAAGTLHDVVMLLQDPEWSLLRLWRMSHQYGVLIATGVTLQNLSGLLNLAGFWRSQGFTFFPHSMSYPPGPNFFLSLGTDFVRDERIERRRQNDIHVAKLDEGAEGLLVRRVTTHSYFPSYRHRPIYASEVALAEGVLLGVCERAPALCWVRMGSVKPGSEGAEFQYQMWDAVLHWLDDALRFVAPCLVEGLAPVHVDVILSDAEKWSNTRADDVPRSGGEPTMVVDRGRREIAVTLPLAFLSLVARPTNDAEQALLRVILQELPALLPACPGSQWPTVEDILDHVFDGTDARQLHVFPAESQGNPAGLMNTAAPIFTAPEDRSDWYLGLAWRVMQRPAAFDDSDSVRIENQEDAVTLLRAAADQVRQDLEARLATLDRQSVLVASLTNGETILKDREWWARTARAYSAIPTLRDEAESVAADRESKRAIAHLASRTLVEMANCTSRLTGGAPVSDAEFQRLLAGAALLLELARDADIVNRAPAVAEVRVSQSGFIAVNTLWIADVVAPFARASFAREFTRAIAGYERRLIDQDTQLASVSDATMPTTRSLDAGSSNAGRDPALTPYDDPVFGAAFAAEYGLSPRQLLDAVGLCIAWAREADTPIIVTSVADLAQRLKLSREMTSTLLTSLGLHTRRRWNQTPGGYRSADWYPWRFRRRLSLMTRPFVLLEAEGDSDQASAAAPLPGKVVIGVAQLVASTSYLLEHLEKGWFPQEFVSTKAMRRYLGAATHKRGEEFNGRVANALRALGWQARPRVKMSQLGAPSKYGDVDVFAWKDGDPRVLAIECKRLRPARTVAEVIEVLTQFRGKADDYLGVHLARIDWLRANRETAGKALGLSLTDRDLTPMLVTNAPVPMQFVSDLPLPAVNVVAIDALAAYL
jgi:methylmalonyl-CoA mutase cobalamin-binding subunit